MNNGELWKSFYSNDEDVNALIEKAIKNWPYGYCKSGKQPDDVDCLNIEIKPFNDIESTASVIDAYMHLMCGFSIVCVDYDDMKGWVSSGDIFRQIEICGDPKKLAHECWHALIKEKVLCEQNGLEISGIFMTVLGVILTLENFELYCVLGQNFADLFIPNTCLLPLEEEIKIKFHLALKKKPVVKFNENTPMFLRG